MVRIVHTNLRAYGFSPDDAGPDIEKTWALLSARAVDEVTGEPPRTQLAIETDEVEMFPRVADGGLIGLAGIPARAFPDLNAPGYDVTFTVRAAGYIPLTQTATIALNLGVIGAFAPTDIGALPLRRAPVVIKGRTVVAGGGPNVPAVGATVQVTGIWPTLPSAAAVVPAAAPNILYLRPGLYFNRDLVNDRVRRRELQRVLGEDKRLLAAVEAGTDTIELSDRINVVVGSVLAIGAQDPERTEFGTVSAVGGATTADQPARITLAHPLARAHLRDELVIRVVPQAPGADNQLVRETIAGDRCVVLDGLADLAGVGAIEIAGGAALVEYHAIRLYTATSNADGYYRLPPINRAAQLELQADDGVHPNITQIIVPNYAAGEHIVDFVFRAP